MLHIQRLERITTLNSGAPAVFLADTNNTDYSGVLLDIQHCLKHCIYSILDSGTVAKFNGVVTEFNVTTKVDIISFDGSNVK